MRKKSLFVFTLLFLTSTLLIASQRYVAFEVFTQTW
jgi:hypothetical protein